MDALSLRISVWSSDLNLVSELQPTVVNAFPVVTVLPIAKWESMFVGMHKEDKTLYDPLVSVVEYALQYAQGVSYDWKTVLNRDGLMSLI